MNAETNPQFDSPELQANIDSLLEKAISDGYFTTTRDHFVGYRDLECDARIAYMDWCESHDRIFIEYEHEDSAVYFSHRRPLTPASAAQLRDLAAEFGLEFGPRPGDQRGYINMKLFQVPDSNSQVLPNQRQFLGRLAAILTDPASFSASPV